MNLDITRLKDIREDHDITQYEMAEILGVKRAAYSLWEIAVNIIPLENLVDFANYFKVSIDYILNTSNKMNKNIISSKLDLKKLGENLKTLRKNNGITQKEMAEIIGAKQSTINRYEKGNICISTIKLFKYSKYFKVSMDVLLNRVEKK